LDVQSQDLMVSFPEKYESNLELQNKISQLENRTMTTNK